MVVSRGLAIVSMWCALIAVEAQSCRALGQENKAGTAASQTGRDQPIPRRQYVASGSISELVLVPAVCEELKISTKQRQVILDAEHLVVSVGEIGQIHVSLRNARLALERAVQSGDPRQFGKAQRELAVATNRQARATEACDESVRALLTPAQNERLVQIMLRQEGIRAVTRPDVAENVGMTKEQIAQFHGILAEREAEVEAAQAAERATPEAQARLAEWSRVVKKHQNHETLNDQDLRVLAESNKRAKVRGEELDRFEQTTDALLTRVLTPPQQRRLSALFGPDFDLHLLTRRAQPKPERKQSSRPDAKKGTDVGKEGAPSNETRTGPHRSARHA